MDMRSDDEKLLDLCKQSIEARKTKKQFIKCIAGFNVLSQFEGKDLVIKISKNLAV